MIEVPYGSVKFVWVSDHYDFHREGICMHQGKLARFTCIEDYPPGYGTCGEECEGCPKCEGYPIVCNIWPLTPIERLRWMRRKKAFEMMIGYYWSYPHRGQGVRFQDRKPRWFSRLLFRLYYLPQRWRLKRLQRS